MASELDTCIIHSNRIEGEPDDDKIELYRALYEAGPPGTPTIEFMRKAHLQLFRDRPDNFPGHFRSDEEVPTAAKEVCCKTMTGKLHVYLSSDQVQSALETLVEECKERFYPLCSPMHAKERWDGLVDYLAFFHQRFMAIHPFVDGNGRTGRLFTWCIMKGFYKYPVPIFEEDKSVYFGLLGMCDEKKDYRYLSGMFTNIPKFFGHNDEAQATATEEEEDFDIDAI